MVELWFEPKFAWLQSSCIALLSHSAFPNTFRVSYLPDNRGWASTGEPSLVNSSGTVGEGSGVLGEMVVLWGHAHSLKQSLISDHFPCPRKRDSEILISNVHRLFYERCHRERSELTQIPLWKSLFFLGQVAWWLLQNCFKLSSLWSVCWKLRILSFSVSAALFLM